MRLIDADALKAYVNSLSTHPLNEWDTWGVLAAIDKQPTIPAPRWVRCEEALPEIGQRVIVYDGWMQFMTRKDDQRLNGKMYWENEEGNWERVYDEAYWMPIEPPKEDA